MVKYLVLAILSSAIAYLLSDAAEKLSYVSYKETLNALLNISSIIFAISGAWIAIIYPKAIGKVFHESEKNYLSVKDAETDTTNLSELVEIVLVSATVLMVILAIQFTTPIILKTASPSLVKQLKILFFFVVTLLTLSQLHAVFRVIIANYFFLSKLRIKNAKDRLETLHK